MRNAEFRIAVYEEFVPKMMEADAIEAVIKETLVSNLDIESRRQQRTRARL